MKNTVICACAKDENDYIQEWIDYHLLLGFDTIYIYDDHSKIPLSETIRLDERVIVINWTDKIKRKVFNYKKTGQGKMYNDFLVKYSKSFTWVAFIDIDEFIVLKKHKTISKFLKDYSDNTIGAVMLNWVCFGYSGQLIKRDIPVTERFTSRGIETNEWVKTIARTEAIQDIEHCHFVNLKPGYNQVNTDKKLYPYISSDGIKHWEKWEYGKEDIACINHYSIKSLIEFDIKQKRGRADNAAEINTTNYRYEFDKNDVFDNTILQNIKMLKKIEDTSLEKVLKPLWNNYYQDYTPIDRTLDIIRELGVNGVDTENIRYLLNTLCGLYLDGGIYVENGVLHGSGIISAALNNEGTFYGFDSKNTEEDNKSFNENVSKFNIDNIQLIDKEHFGEIMEENDIKICHYNTVSYNGFDVKDLYMIQPYLLRHSLLIISGIDKDEIYNPLQEFLRLNNCYKVLFEVKHYTDECIPHNWFNGVIILEKL